MQITFGQYFKSFNTWLAPVYWISGEGDGRLDIEQRLLHALPSQNPMIKRLVLKKKDEIVQVKDHFRSQDLFNESPLLVVTIPGALCVDLIEKIQNLTLQPGDKIIIYSPKLTPKAKNNPFWTKPIVAHYALWPYTIEQASMWWQTQCQEMNLKPTALVTQAVLQQTGGRIDELRQITSVWQLQYPGGGVIDEVPPGTHQLSDKVYDEAYAWLSDGKLKKGFDIETNMPFYFALKQTVDEVVQFAFFKQSEPPNMIMKKLGWWPQKLKNIQNLADRKSFAFWLDMVWMFSHIEMARFGASQHSFKQLMDCFYHRQPLPLNLIDQR